MPPNDLDLLISSIINQSINQIHYGLYEFYYFKGKNEHVYTYYYLNVGVVVVVVLRSKLKGVPLEVDSLPLPT